MNSPKFKTKIGKTRLYVPQFYLEAKLSFPFQNLVDFPLSVKSTKRLLIFLYKNKYTFTKLNRLQ